MIELSRLIGERQGQRHEMAAPVLEADAFLVVAVVLPVGPHCQVIAQGNVQQSVGLMIVERIATGTEYSAVAEIKPGAAVYSQPQACADAVTPLVIDGSLTGQRLGKEDGDIGENIGTRVVQAQADPLTAGVVHRERIVAVNYAPSDRYSLSLDYTRSSIFSDLAILLPQTLAEDRSVYDERSHGIGAGVGIGVYRGSRLDLGYRGILSSGSYPLNYHQPYASLYIPLRNHLAVRTNWQYYGYNEKSVGLQDWRGHLVTVSLALSY